MKNPYFTYSRTVSNGWGVGRAIQKPTPGYWTCHDCGEEFSWGHELPSVDKQELKLDVTTYGNTNTVYLAQEIVILLCEECAS